MSHTRSHVDLLNDPIERATQLMLRQMDAAERILNPKPNRNPLRDALPPGMTMKGLSETVKEVLG